MGIHLIPDSWGSPLREDNFCHMPDGKLAPKGQGTCTGGPQAGTQFETAGFNFDSTEQMAETFRNRYQQNPTTGYMEYSDLGADEQKAAIAKALGKMIEGKPGFRALRDDLRANSIGDKHDEYDSFVEDKTQEIDDAYYEEGADEYKREREKYIEEQRDSFEAAKEAFDKALENAPEDPYGDTTDYPVLDPSWEHPGHGRTYTQAEIIAQWNEDGEEALFLKDPHRTQFDVAFDEDLATEGHEYFDKDDDGARDKWFEENWSSDNVDYSDIPSYESWLEDEYGVKDGGDDEGDNYIGDTDGERVASSLVSQWANSSGDEHVWSVALQKAVKAEFGIDGMTSHLGNDGGKFREHEEILRRFVRAMYDNTQEWLKKKGITEVTVLRGVKGQRYPGPVTPGMADVVLQPASSFSASFQTAASFAGHYHTSYLVAVHVPASQILGTARSGFGCLNEQEVVVLGGKHRAFVARTEDLTDFDRFKRAAQEAHRNGLLAYYRE